MFGIGMSEMLIIGIIALILIGPDQIPETARTIGKFLNELRRATDDFKGQISNSVDFPKSIDDFVKAQNKQNFEDPTPKYEHHPDPAAPATEVAGEETLPKGEANDPTKKGTSS